MEKRDLVFVALNVLYGGQLLINRWLAGRQLERVMRAKSAAEPGPSDRAHSWEPRPGEPPRADLGVDLISRRPLPQEAAELSDALARRARRLLRWGTLLDLLAAVAYLRVAPSESDVSVIAGCMLMLALLRYIFYRKQHIILGAEFSGTFYFHLAYFLASPRWQVPIRWVLLVLAVMAAFSRQAGAQTVDWSLLAVAALHGLAELVLMLHVQRLPSLSMLILRVFRAGHEVSEEILFKSIQKTWAHFGRSFAILDNNLLKRRTDLFTFEVLLVSLFFHLSVMVIVYDNEYKPLKWQEVMGALLWMAGLLVADYLWVYRLVALSRIGSPKKLARRLDLRTRWPRNLDGRYACVEAACYDNTWRESVSEFATRARVVLMNLANYSPERRGCTEEVEWLFDHVPLERIVFLANAADLPVITDQLMAPCWRELKPSSPNLIRDKGQVQVFLLDDPGPLAGSPQLLAWLQHIAARSDRSAGAEASSALEHAPDPA